MTSEAREPMSEPRERPDGPGDRSPAAEPAAAAPEGSGWAEPDVRVDPGGGTGPGAAGGPAGATGPAATGGPGGSGVPDGPGESGRAAGPGGPGGPTGESAGDGRHRSGEQSLSRNTAVLLVAGFATVLLAALAELMPVPYVALKPGPAINTLGQHNGKPLIKVDGHATYPTSGTLDLTTVTVAGGPGAKLNVADIIAGVLDPSIAVVPEEDVFPTGQTQQQNQQQNQQEMATSQEQATAAALAELGIKVPTTLTISQVDPQAPAASVLRHGDVLLAVNGARTDDLAASVLRHGDVLLAVNGARTDDLAAVRVELQKVRVGDPVTVTVRRGGTEQKLTTRTRSAEGRTVLGIFIDPTFRFPFQVKIQIDDVGGPSAGMMFALGIIDVLTPGSLTGGQNVAGTGTIDSDGTVGAIGGIQEKMIGARSAGARWFLAPADDCGEVVGHVPDGLRVVRVSTLHEARTAVEAIAAGTATGLPTCTK